MTISLKPYPAYKDSGVPWLGEVPEHWELRRIKSLVSNVTEQTADRQPEEIYVALEHVESWTGRIRNSGSDVSFDSQVKRFRAGDVLFGKLRPYLAKVTRPMHDGVCVGEFFVLRPVDSAVSAGYLGDFLRSKPIIDAIDSSTFGAKMPRAEWQFVGNMTMAFPPLSEQAAVARFLNFSLGRITRYIRAKQKLIKVLEEKKQAIVHRAVTRGLNPNVRLKASGVEWLDEMPEHWQIQPLKQLLVRMDYGTSENLGREGAIRVLTMAHIQDGEIVPPEHGSLNVLPVGLLLERFDLLFNRTNSADLVGKVGIFRGSASDNISFASYLVRLRTKPEHNPIWLNYLLNSTRFWAFARSQALLSLHQANLNSTRYGQMLLPVPPNQEQREIANYLTTTLDALRETIDATTHNITLMREYRTRLIADVVTGKLDVREAAALLPDETEELEPMEYAESALEGDGESEIAEVETQAEDAIS